MEAEQAIVVLRALADGIDPETGEVMPNDSPYQQARVVRALYAALAALGQQEKSIERKRRLPTNTGKAWNAEEDREMVVAYANGRSLQEIAKAYGRTVAAIELRLIKLGKIISPLNAVAHRETSK